jgi:hypothetical protein
VVPKDLVTVTVASGWLTLSGTLDWPYQKDAAARAVRELMGVKGVTNNITVQPRVKTVDVRDKMEAAFKRSAEIDARRITHPSHPPVYPRTRAGFSVRVWVACCGTSSSITTT